MSSYAAQSPLVWPHVKGLEVSDASRFIEELNKARDGGATHRAAVKAAYEALRKDNPGSGDVHVPRPMGKDKKPLAFKESEEEDDGDEFEGDLEEENEFDKDAGGEHVEELCPDCGESMDDCGCEMPTTPYEMNGEDGTMKILKVDEEQRMVYGWASVISEGGRPHVDSQGDVIMPAELEKATTEFMKDVRKVLGMHRREEDGAVPEQGDGMVVHSLPLTAELAKALGVESDREGWIVGVHVPGDELWAGVKSGEFAAFSIGGSGTRVKMEDSDLEKAWNAGKHPRGKGGKFGRGAAGAEDDHHFGMRAAIHSHPNYGSRQITVATNRKLKEGTEYKGLDDQHTYRVHSHTEDTFGREKTPYFRVRMRRA